MSSKNLNSLSLIDECYRQFAPQKYYQIAYIGLFGSLVLYLIAEIGYKVFSSELPTIIDFLIVIIQILLILSTVAFASFLVFGTVVPALAALASAAGAKRAKPKSMESPQPNVETPTFTCVDTAHPKDLSISISADFEKLFQMWMVTRIGHLRGIVGIQTVFSKMKKTMQTIQNWCQTDLHRLGYILYHSGAVEKHGKNLSYSEWISLFFAKLGRNDAPAIPDTSKFMNIASKDVDFNAFRFLYDAALKESKDGVTFSFEDIVPPKAKKAHKK